MGKGPDCGYDRQTDHIRGQLWHRYSVTVTQFMGKTFEVMTSTQPLGIISQVLFFDSSNPLSRKS
jgi:hypothetical protein